MTDASLDVWLKQAVSQPRSISTKDGGAILALALNCKLLEL